MKPVLFLLIAVIITFFPESILKSQNIPVTKDVSELETKYSDLQDSYSSGKVLLDSLRNKLDARVKEINIEKSRPSPDKDKITSLMANSVTLSNNIDEQQNKVNKIEKSIAAVKIKLSEKYSVIIDSLKEIQKKGLENKEETANLILFYAAKRLEVSPEIFQLSFNPYKILELDLNKSKDPADQKIYSEYLNNALQEVNNILLNISSENTEINQVIELQRKTNKFIEETELESGVASAKLAQQTSGGETGSNIRSGAVYDESKNNSLSNNAQVYARLLEQLSTIKSLSVRQMPDETLRNLEKNIDLYSYEKLLNEVKKRLTDYKKLLEQKIGPSR
jgi:hypothetical protein